MVAVLLLGAVCGWRRRSWVSTLLIVLAGLVLAEGVDLGAIMITAYSAPAKLGRVHSLVELVGGTSDPDPGHDAFGHLAIRGRRGAGGLDRGRAGNPPPTDASAADRACRRSVDSYPVDLAQVAGLKVTSLACSGATIAAGRARAADDPRSDLAAADRRPVGRRCIDRGGEHRRQRREVVGHTAHLRDLGRLRQRRRAGLLPEPPRTVQHRLAAAGHRAPTAAEPPPRAGEPLLRPVRRRQQLPRRRSA